MKIKHLLIVIVLILNFNLLSASIKVTRNIMPATHADSIYIGEFFENNSFSAELGRGGNSFGGEMDWSFKLIGLSEIYRISEKSSVFFLLGHELNSNPYNDIAFNPRKATWEENIVLNYDLNDIIFQLSIFHRCKHDIDNTDSPRDDIPNNTYNPTKRVLILNGLGFGLPEMHLKAGEYWTFNLSALAEYYVLARDYRQPSFETDTWQNAKGAFRLNALALHNIGEKWQLRFNLYWATMLINTHENSFYNTLNNDYRFEMAMSRKGRKNAIDFFFSYEKLFDEVGYINPHQTDFWHIGLRLRGDMFR